LKHKRQQKTLHCRIKLDEIEYSLNEINEKKERRNSNTKEKVVAALLFFPTILMSPLAKSPLGDLAKGD